MLKVAHKKNPRRAKCLTGIYAKNLKLKYGEGGIRTLDTGINPYNGLANRRFRPLSHLSKSLRLIYYSKNFAVYLLSLLTLSPLKPAEKPRSSLVSFAKSADY